LHLNAILTRFLVLWQSRERGQTMAEYAVVLGVISAILLLAMAGLSGAISGALGRVTGDI
jgi:Flp pilus assembly pilin Flp